MSLILILKQLRTALEGMKRDLLLAVNLEEGVQPCDLEKVGHSLVDLDELHLPSPLPDSAIAAHQLAHAIAVHVFHPREIEQEPLVTGTGEDVNQVTQLGTTLTQREFANHVNHNDSVELSCGELKSHGEFAGRYFSRAESYIAWSWLTTKRPDGHRKAASDSRALGAVQV